jgi:hypothetical protein
LCALGFRLVALRYKRQSRRLAILKPFGFFTVSLGAGVIAWWKVLAGNQQIVWQPTPRLGEPSCFLATAQSLQSANVDYCVDPDFDAESYSPGGAHKPTRDLAVIGEKSC